MCRSYARCYEFNKERKVMRCVVPLVGGGVPGVGTVGSGRPIRD